MELVLIDRDALLTELRQVFDVKTAETLLSVLDKVAAQIRQAGVTREDFSELKQVVLDLAEKISRLAAAHERAEARLSGVEDRLTGVETHLTGVETRMDRVEAAIERLTEAQARSEERLSRVESISARNEDRLSRLEISTAEHREVTARLERGIAQLQRQVGGLSETVGGDIEDIAYIVLHDVLRREFGWQVGVLERTWQNWNNEPEEIDVFGSAIDPARPEQTIWIVGEAKHNLTAREVDRFVRQVGRARQHLTGEVFAVCFCYRARPEVQQQVQAAGLRLVFSYGKLV